MPSSRPFDDISRQEVEKIIQDSTLSDEALHNNAGRYLQVLAHPSFRDINRPAWVRRIQRFSLLWITYTSSKLFDALYETADALTLVAGKRYVSAAVCACASCAESEAASHWQDKPRCVAEALSQLATAWIGYMLWPCKLACSWCLLDKDELSDRSLCRWNEVRLGGACKTQTPASEL